MEEVMVLLYNILFRVCVRRLKQPFKNIENPAHKIFATYYKSIKNI